MVENLMLFTELIEVFNPTSISTTEFKFIFCLLLSFLGVIKNDTLADED